MTDKKWDDKNLKFVPCTICKKCKEGIVKCDLSKVMKEVKRLIIENSGSTFEAQDVLKKWQYYGGLLCPKCKGNYKTSKGAK